VSDRRVRKRFFREHRHDRESGVRIVYRPKTAEEARRRVARAQALVGTPFLHLPSRPGDQEIVFHTSKGTPIPAGAVEMVYNDMLFMDAVSDNGQDGPLYEDTCTPEMLEVLNYARRMYAN
jgi:hypothetical protein